MARGTLQVEHKRELRRYALSRPGIKQEALVAWFQQRFGQSISRSAVSKISRDKKLDANVAVADLRNRKTQKSEKWPMLEKALALWIHQAERSSIEVPIDGNVLRYMAQDIFKELHPSDPLPAFSNGWLCNFRKRQGIHSIVLHGEVGSVPLQAEQQMVRIRELCKDYNPCDIYNCDESGLFWRMTPDRSYGTMQKGGRKKNKSRITAHFCANADGSHKLPIWFIGSAKAPRAFRGTSIDQITYWRYNKKAWMNTIIMEEWLYWFDAQCSGRKVLLLMDNFSAHEVAWRNIKSSERPLQNTRVEFLPPNATSRYQPLDQGIIYAWKRWYRRYWISFMVKEYREGRDAMSTVTVLDAVRWGIAAWMNDVKQSTLAKCFAKAFQTPQSEPDAEDNQQDDTFAIEESYEECGRVLSIREMMDINQFLNPEDKEVTDTMSPSIADIVASFQDEDQDAAAETELLDEDPPKPPSFHAAYESAVLLQRFYEYHGDPSDKLPVLTQCEREIDRLRCQKGVERDLRSFFA